MEHRQETQVQGVAKEDASVRATAVVPAVDATETKECWKLFVDMPGVDQRALELSVDKGILTIRGEPIMKAIEGASCVFREHSPRNYERSFALSDGVNTEGITAELQHGVLTVTLPKSESLKPRTIPISVREN